MKILSKNEFLTIMLLTLSLRANDMQFECVLSAQFYPLSYVMITRSVNARIRFMSNCLRLRDFTFEGFFTFKNRLTKSAHPTTLNLHIYGNKYKVSFNSPQVADPNSILRRLEYLTMDIYPSTLQSGHGIPIDRDNRVLLDEKVKGSFSFHNLNRLLLQRNPRRCAISKKNKEMTCIIR